MKNEVFEAQFQPLFTKFLTSHSETTTHMIRMWNLSNPETIKQKTYSDKDMQYIHLPQFKFDINYDATIIKLSANGRNNSDNTHQHARYNRVSANGRNM